MGSLKVRKCLLKAQASAANYRYFSTCNRAFAMPVIAPDDLYLDKPRYPKIRDTSKDAKLKYERLDRYERIKNMKTVSEKILEVTTRDRQRFFLFRGCVNRYNATEFVQHVTKTHIVRGLPESYSGGSAAAPLVDQIRDAILDSVACESAKNEWTLPKWKNQDEVQPAVPESSILRQTAHLMIGALSSQYPHLHSGMLVERPRCQAFWWRTNDHVDLNKAKFMRRSMFQVPTYQLDWTPDFFVRMPDPLPPILDRDSPLCASSDVPYCPYHPKNYNMKMEPKRFLNLTPGFWPGDNCQFPYLSLEASSPILDDWRKVQGEHGIEEALDQAAMICSFGWLLASATIQGFTPYHELTYPLVAQSVYTNGKSWSFYVYQMNTLAVHPDVDEKTHRNVCWTSGPMDLYETVEDGQLKGVNEEVLKTLIKFFTSAPQRTVPSWKMRPYLDGPEKQEALDLLKARYDNRPDFLEHKTEVPTWHHVYKFNPKAPLSPRVKMH